MEFKKEPGVYSRSYTVSPDCCDKKGGLSPAAVFNYFQAISAEHAEELGIGVSQMRKKGKFWVIAHNRVDFEPGAWLLNELTASTWAMPESPESFRVSRCYTLENKGRIIARSKAQWAILDFGGKPVCFGASEFPEDYPFPSGDTIEEEPTWFQDDFTEEDLSEIYTVRPTDIDFGGHMNNIIYIERLLDQFPADQITGDKIRSLEIHYGAIAKEKEKLYIYKKTEDKKVRIAMKKEDGKTAVMASVLFF